MKHAVKVDSGAIICVSSFIKTSSGIQKLKGGIHRDADRKEMAYEDITELGIISFN
jgi:hypothetical protein